MKIIVFVGFLLCLLSACLKQENFDINSSIVYHPEFSIPIGKPELLMEEFVNALNNLQILPDSLVNDTSAFFYENNYYEIPKVLSNEYTEEFSVSILGEDSDRIVSLMFRANIINRIPAKIVVQIYFANEAMQYIDSMYHEGVLIVNSAQVDDEGNVIESVVLQEDTYFDKDRISKISNTSYIVIYTSLHIINEPGIIAKYYSTQDFIFQGGSRVGINIENK